MKFKKILEHNPELRSASQLQAGNYKMKHIKLYGMDISIENEKETYRSGTDENGKQWKQKMHCDYGYIKGTTSKDKDHIDVFIGPKKKSATSVFVINQLKNDNKIFDEHKCILGVISKEDAEQLYLKNYESGWNHYDKNIIEMPIEDFKEWCKNEIATKKKAEIKKD